MDMNRQAYSESLKNTLSCYQLSSADSLSGPSGYPALAAQLWFKENNHSPPIPRPPTIQIPVLIPKDTSTKRSETYLSGEKISCFIVGGEKRLCLPQILTTVLKDFSIQEINRTCAELHIYCSRCSPQQLEILKVLGILPFNTTQCGLITKTDAERLVSALGAELHLNGKHIFNTEKSKGILVYHECFGRADGLFYPNLYVSPDSTCIACLDCRSTFSPARFVLHSHSILEKRTCHWGFDRDNWRHYILVPRNVEESKYVELEKQLNLLKARFDPSADAYIHNYQLKRRLKPEIDSLELNSKRLKGEKEINDANSISSVAPTFGAPFPAASLKPWTSANLSNLADIQAIQGTAFMKALLMQERPLLPSFFQFASPSVAPPSVAPPTSATASVTAVAVAPPRVLPPAATEWTKPSHKTVDPPNVSLLPLDLQKKSASASKEVLNGNAKPCSDSGQRNNKPCSSKHAFESPAYIKTEATGAALSYPVPCRRSSDDPARTPRSNAEENHPPSERSNSDPSLDKVYPKKKSIWKSGFNDAGNSKRTNNGKYPEQKRKEESQNSREEEKNAMNSAVVAASAMLELSSSVEDRSIIHAPKPCANVREQRTGLESNTNSIYPKVAPFPTSKDHFKWTFADASFIISAAGTDELKEFQKLLNVSSHPDSHRILLEVARMKSEQEEKLDIQNRVKQDAEMELERLKTSMQRCMGEANEERKAFRHQLDTIKSKQQRELKEANNALIELGKSLSELQLHSGHTEERDSLQRKIFERLHKQFDEKVDEVRDLEKQLLEERDRRLLAERRVQEVIEVGRGRLSLLMDGNISSKMHEAVSPQRSSKLAQSSNSLPPSSVNGLE